MFTVATTAVDEGVLAETVKGVTVIAMRGNWGINSVEILSR